MEDQCHWDGDFFCFFWKKGSMRACAVVDFMWSTKPRILVCEVFSVSFVWMEVASTEARCVGSAAVVWEPTWKLGNKSSTALCRCCVSVRARSVWASVSERSGRCEDSLCLSWSTLGSLPSFWLHVFYYLVHEYAFKSFNFFCFCCFNFLHFHFKFVICSCVSIFFCQL
jgi:hypothetical protein